MKAPSLIEPHLPSGSAEVSRPEVRAALVDLGLRALTAHPELAESLTAFFKTVWAANDGEVHTWAQYCETIQAGDLLLATAMAAGSSAAVAAFEKEMSEELSRATQVVGSGRGDDVRQILLKRLFVDEPGRKSAIAQYQGRGPLRAWVRVSVMREAYRLAEHDRPLSSQLPEGLTAPEDTELHYMRLLYRREFAAVFQEALATLTSRQRNLLRYAYLDGLGVEEIARLHGVHRVSASRWLSEARERLGNELRGRLRHRLKLSPSDEQGLMQLVISRPDISFGSLL